MEMSQSLIKLLSILKILLLFSSTLLAQERICGNEYLKYPNTLKNNEHEIFNSNRSPISIEVVIHVVYNTQSENISDNLISSQLEILNQAFNAENADLSQVPYEFKNIIANVGIRFCLASKDEKGNNANGIIRVPTSKKEIGLTDDLYFTNRSGSDAWNTDKYLNIWVANTGDNISGFGTFPGMSDFYKTGLVIHPKYFGKNNHPKYGLGKTTVHELGHFFGLLHTWGETSDCNEDDGINDTPLQMKSYKGCPPYPQSGCSESEMFMNFMDYVDDKCMYFFTTGQKEKMLSVLEVYRKELKNVDIECHSKEANDFTLFPNPTDGIFNIEPSYYLDEEINIYSLDCRKMKTEIFKTEKSIEVNIGNQPQGLYIVKVKNLKPKLLYKIWE
ncbi:MAG: hypothetical protein RLZZ546_1159 [Bacteroidota bacterium]|jgi:hypothetical protein